MIQNRGWRYQSKKSEQQKRSETTEQSRDKIINRCRFLTDQEYVPNVIENLRKLIYQKKNYPQIPKMDVAHKCVTAVMIIVKTTEKMINK